MRVLVLCSHESTRQRVAYTLRFEGAGVVEARTAAEALQLADCAPVDMAILDDPRAEELAEALRARPGLADLTIVTCFEVVRPSRAATYVWPSPMEATRALALVRQLCFHGNEQFAKLSRLRHPA